MMITLFGYKMSEINMMVLVCVVTAGRVSWLVTIDTQYKIRMVNI